MGKAPRFACASNSERTLCVSAAPHYRPQLHARTNRRAYDLYFASRSAPYSGTSTCRSLRLAMCASRPHRAIDSTFFHEIPVRADPLASRHSTVCMYAYSVAPSRHFSSASADVERAALAGLDDLVVGRPCADSCRDRIGLAVGVGTGALTADALNRARGRRIGL